MDHSRPGRQRPPADTAAARRAGVT